MSSKNGSLVQIYEVTPQLNAYDTLAATYIENVQYSVLDFVYTSQKKTHDQTKPPVLREMETPCHAK